ncbi:Ribonuclease H-like superfamily protein [Rhynchospora pubera]|nr:Ribonuclease H-like superfamily protein [Rhynchospora pubera]
MSQGNKTWVQVCQAKYFPQIGFWRANNTRGCSSLWREVVKLRDFFKQDIKWEVTNGKKVYALSQPWFSNWDVQRDASRRDTIKKVSQLIDPQSGTWCLQELQRLFGLEKAALIQSEVPVPVQQTELPDRLIWCKTKSGRYTVKDGYYELDKRSTTLTPAALMPHWKIIAKLNYLAPKVKIFLWRLLSKALPLANNMHRRIATFSPICQRCHQENEYESHCFFFCPGSRAVWFANALALRSHDQPLDMVQAFQQTVPYLDEYRTKLYAYTLWELWKGRNEVIMQQKQFDPCKILKAVDAWMRVGENNVQAQCGQYNQIVARGYEIRERDWILIVDASWQSTGNAGTAYLLYCQGKVYAWGYNFHVAQDPFHAESIAMLEGIKKIVEVLQLEQNQQVCIFSDCLTLVSAINDREVDFLPSWRSTPIVHQILNFIKDWKGKLKVQHVRREAVQSAHALANHARRSSDADFGDALHCQSLLAKGVSMELDNLFFVGS